MFEESLMKKSTGGFSKSPSPPAGGKTTNPLMKQPMMPKAPQPKKGTTTYSARETMKAGPK